MNNEQLIHELFSSELQKSNDKKVNSLSLDIYPKHALLYSYSTVIGKRFFDTETYLISTRNYSNTTSNHQSMLRSAADGYNAIYVNDINQTVGENVADFKRTIINYSRKHLRARTADYTNIIDEFVVNMKNYLEFVKVDKRTISYKEVMNIINTFNNNEINDFIAFMLNFSDTEKLELEKKRKKEDATRKREFVKGKKEFCKLNIEEIIRERETTFINYSSNNSAYNLSNDAFTNYLSKAEKFDTDAYKYALQHRDILRTTKNDHIVTSQGILLSNVEAISLYHKIKNNLLNVGDDVIGYKVRSVGNEYLVIGCHNFNRANVEVIYNKIKGGK